MCLLFSFMQGILHLSIVHYETYLSFLLSTQPIKNICGNDNCQEYIMYSYNCVGMFYVDKRLHIKCFVLIVLL